MKKNKLYPDFWKTSDNSKISCKEKIVILNNNVIELQNLINQIYDEAILMGVDKEQIKKVINNLSTNLNTELKG
tara:strand:- start:1010 stop:1231 length:222 start_codon:yes stop_codon:yes gene_type:complete